MGNCSIVRLFGCLIVVLTASLGAFAQEKVQPRVTITSQPAGASVIIDGMDRGTTPITLFDIAPGRHHLKYRLAGYEERDRFFDTNDGPYIEKNEVLEEVKGILLLKTDPPDCDIQIDGVSVGRTPKLITHLPVRGTYGIKLRKAGYQNQSISVRFNGRKPLVREEKMIQSSGTINVITDPAGAEVTVNGVSQGVAPVEVEQVPKGRAVVKFHLDGFADEVRELSVNAGDVQTLSVSLRALPGTIHLSSVPAGARFYVNDEPRGTSPLTLANIKPGSYDVRAELEGYGTISKYISIDNGGSTNVEFRLSNVMGRMEIRTSPPGAMVYLDGKRVGETKSADPSAEFSDILPIENVLEGEHTLVVKKEGYADKTSHAKVESSRTAQGRLRLTRIFTPDVEIVTARTTCKGVLLGIKPDYIEIESSPGIKRSFPRDEVREIRHLK